MSLTAVIILLLLPDDRLLYVSTGDSPRGFVCDMGLDFIWKRGSLCCDFQTYNIEALVLSLAAALSIIHGKATLQDL